MMQILLMAKTSYFIMILTLTMDLKLHLCLHICTRKSHHIIVSILAFKHCTSTMILHTE